MRIGIRIPPCRPLPEVVAAIGRAEALGFHSVAVPDASAGLRDVMLTLALAARDTERIVLTSAVTNVVTRQPIVLASEARSIAELATGRFRLGIGAGYSAVFLTGQRPARTAQLREGLRVVMGLLAGETVHTENGDLVLHDAPGAIPVLLGVNGPRNIALAVEVCDGLITPNRHLARKVADLTAAIETTERSAPFDLVVTAVASVTEDLEQVARQLKPRIIRYIQSEGPEEFQAAGFDLEIPDVHIALPDGKDIGPGGREVGHQRDDAAAIEIAARWIPDDVAIWFARHIALCGSGEEIAARIAAYGALGVNEVVFGQSLSYALPISFMEEISSEVIPRLRSPQPVASPAPGEL